MSEDIDGFIIILKNQISPFKYEEPVVTRYLVLSYDESIERLLPEFDYFIIAALHAKGVTFMKSYVTRTIIFDIQSREKGSQEALSNWKNYLLETFGEDSKLMLCMIKQFTNTNAPILGVNQNNTREKQFDDIYETVVKKFITL